MASYSSRYSIRKSPKSEFFWQSSPLMFTFSSNRETMGSDRIPRFLIDTAGSASMTPSNPLNLYTKKIHVGSSDLIETAESELCKRLSRISRRIRSHKRNGLSPWIRALRGLCDKKNRGSKISWHCAYKFVQVLKVKLHTWMVKWKDSRIYGGTSLSCGIFLHFRAKYVRQCYTRTVQESSKIKFLKRILEK
jgi:hypothetical protein